MIVDQLISEVRDTAKKRVAVEVRIGLKYTAVLLDDGGCGLAATLSHQLPYPLEYPGNFRNRGAGELVDLARSTSILPSSVGVAAINALLKSENIEIVTGDITKYLRISKKDTVGMVGAFVPLIPWVQSRAGKLFVFERHPLQGTGEYQPDWAEPLLLPQCSVVIITAASIANKTIDSLLGYLKGAHMVALAGPTTPLSSKVFKKTRINILSGIKVINPHKLLEIVSQGGGTRDFGHSVKKVNIILRPKGGELTF